MQSFLRIKKVLFSIILIWMAIPSMATHYQGGEMTYQFLGVFGGQYRYQFQIDVYVNCLPTSAFPNGEINNVRLCIYNKATNLSFLNVNLQNPVRQIVQPDLPPGCSVPIINQVLCSNLNRFTTNVDLPGPFDQYYAVHERCCREGDIDNLQNAGSTGNAFITQMAPNFVQNSSPQFQDIVIPFLCTGDTVTLSNNAFDPDGDFLVYNFKDNIDMQVGGPFDPAPQCATGTYDLNNIPLVPYAPNYSVAQPFGPGSVAFINASNGLTKYYAPNAGKYSITLEVQEYRDINNDGIQDLIGITNREIIFIAQPCAPNPTPTVTPVVVNGNTVPIINGTSDIDIREGESLTFTFNASDANNDSVYIEPLGDIIDGTNGYTGPLATFPDAVGQGNSSSTFTWQTTCGITGPFLVRVNVKDNGCPPKNDIFFFNINVRPFKAADQLFISDPGQSVDTICLDNIGRNYFVNANNGSNIQWQAQGGTINGVNNLANVNVTWNSAGVNTLQLIETSTLSCSDTSVFDVFVAIPDTVIAVSDTTLCFGQSVQLGATGSTGYQWLPNQFLDNNLVQNPISTPFSTISYFVQGLNGLGCAVGDSVKVEVVQPFAEAGNNQVYCTGDTVQLGALGLVNKVYSWSDASNLNDSTLAQPLYFGTSSGPGANIDTLFVTVIDTISGCAFVDQVIIQTNALPIANAGVADTLCSNESTTIGFATAPGTNCVWTGNFISSPNACQTFVSPINPGSANLPFQYVVQVTNNATNCTNFDTVEVISKPLPPAFAGTDTTICRFQTVDLGGTATPGLVYTWVSSAPGSPISPTSSSSPQQTLNSVGTFQSIVTTINTNPANLCTNRDTVQLIVRALPNVQVIPDTAICSEDSINIGGNTVGVFNYTWNTLSGLTDSTVANPTLSIDNPTQVSQFFNYQLVVQNNNTLCTDSANINVEVKPLPIVDAGVDLFVCSESSDTLGVASIPGYSYTWNTSVDLSDSTISQPIVSPLTGANPSLQSFILQIEWNGCLDEDTVIVTVNPKPVVDSIFGGISICPDLEDVLYTILDTVGFTNYQWGVSGGTIISPINNDSIFVDWGPLNPNASIFMIPTNSFGCVGDTATVPININPILSSPPPNGPNSICLSDANTVLFSVPLTTGYNYVWSSPSINHSQVPIAPGNQVAYNFLETGTALIFVEQQVTTTTSTCLGFSDTLAVTIHPNPDLSIPILGDTSICEFTDSITYSVTAGFPNSTYQWSVFPGGSLPDTVNSVTLSWGGQGNFQVVAFETTEFGCTSGDLFLDVQINPIPETEFASLDSFVCAETTSGNSITVDGFNNSKYAWSIIGGSFELNDSSETAIVTWDPFDPDLEVSVFEISEFDCVGDAIAFTPDIDLSLPLLTRVSLTDPADTFSSVTVDYNKGNDYTELLPDSLTVFRKRATEATWTPIAKVGSNDSTYLDAEQLNRVDNYYEYQVSSVNFCANEVFSPQHNTIKLEGEGIEDLDQLNLSWNEYVNWERGLQEYEIYRRLDKEENFELFQATGSASYTDFSANDGFRHFFRIRAIEGGGDNESWSNEFEVIFLNQARVADIITPNGDGKNDSWKIDNIELYPGTQVKIYNRYGLEVYKNESYQGDWEADDLPSGTYFFQAIFQHLDEPVAGYIQVLR